MKDAPRPGRKHRIDQEKIDGIMYPIAWTEKEGDILRKVVGLRQLQSSESLSS
jgi:hypothetical protein